MGSALVVQERQAGPGRGSPAPEAAVLRDLVLILRRRRSTILCFLLGGLLLGVVAVLVTKKMYQAEATIQLLKRSPAASLTTAGPSDAISGDALEFNLTLQTQVDILKSDAVALAVIDDLKLEQTDPEFAYRGAGSPLSAQEKAAPLFSSPRRAGYVLRVFKKRLQVDAVAGTRLIHVGFEDPSPYVAARVVNSVLKNFVDYSFRSRYQASTEATKWLTEQLRVMKADLERSRATVAELQKQSGVYGPDETHNVITARMEQLNTELVNAEEKLVLKEAVSRAAANGDPDLIAGLVDAGANGGGMNQTLNVLQQLRQQESTAQANLAALTAKFGANYPRVIEARTQLESLEKAVQVENQKMRYRAEAEYTIAKRVRDAAQNDLNAQKREAAALNDRSVDYQLAKRDADAKEALYQQLTARLTEAQVFSGLQDTGFNVIDEALVPDRAAKPSIPLYVAGGAVLGTILGLIFAFLRDVFDESLRDPLEVERLTSTRLLGVIPAGKPGELFAGKAEPESSSGPDYFYQAFSLNPDSRVAESMRALGASVGGNSLLKRTHVIAVTSPSAGEGKAFTVLNLASVLSQNGHRVLIIDGDARRGKISEYLGLGSEVAGVSTVARQGRTPESVQHALKSEGTREILRIGSGEAEGKLKLLSPNAFVLPRGPRGIHVEPLSSAEFAVLLDKFRRDFDFILINTPPLLPVADALAVSKLADLTVVVLRYGKTSRTALQQVMAQLSSATESTVRYVLNRMDPDGPDYIDRAGKEAYGYVASK